MNMLPNVIQNLFKYKLTLLLLIILTLQIFQLSLNLRSSKNTQEFAQKSQLPILSTNSPSTIALQKSNLFSSQNAVIKGNILKIEGTTMTVQNGGGVTGRLELGRAILINQADGKLEFASSSAAIKNIKLNTPVEINLVLIGDKYVVASITY